MYVYFVQAWVPAWTDGPRIKIGKAMNPAARMRDLQVGCPVQLELLGTIECSDDTEALKTERWMHFRFRERRQCGEWFLFGTNAKEEIRKLIETHPRPFLINCKD